MSLLSGKCDLMDLVSSSGDLLRDFEEFKKQTQGAIYQHKKVEIQDWFGEEEFDFIKNHCKFFNYQKHIIKIPNKRYKEGYKRETVYSFVYWDKEYDFKEMKKKGVYVEIPIYFNTLLDLLPYFPYLTHGTSSHVIISDNSYVDEERDEHVTKFAHNELCFDFYKKELADLYLKVCAQYFLYNIDIRTKQIEIIDYKLIDGENYQITVKDPIDYMHNIKYVWSDGVQHTHWKNPTMKDENTILLHKEDVENLLKKDIETGVVKIQYVIKPAEGFPTVK